mgnify:CR=1 FL=1
MQKNADYTHANCTKKQGESLKKQVKSTILQDNYSVFTCLNAKK